MKDRIVEVVIEKMINFGLKGFTMDDIANELSISKKTVYKHFDSKKEIIRAAIRTMIGDSMEKMKEEYQKAENNTERLKAILTSYSESNRKDEVFFELKKHYPEIHREEFEPEMNYKEELAIKTIKDIYQTHDVERKLDVNLLVALLRGFVDELDINFMMEHNLTVDKVLKDLQHLILYGILGKEE